MFWFCSLVCRRLSWGITVDSVLSFILVQNLLSVLEVRLGFPRVFRGWLILPLDEIVPMSVRGLVIEYGFDFVFLLAIYDVWWRV